ncbi:PQQ-binding-like beta-propeller repeat protein [Streptomyces caatingaensis]|uniref:outer membrane protein assembly factor BamB family protein n=1 Tax=Streptomyces caatingaensis TaxID=1678637 RepID=UPI0006727D99|nr:PQQ-binding-like beta-propeller repeat protein [Streptomyces caatingaensis]
MPSPAAPNGPAAPAGPGFGPPGAPAPGAPVGPAYGYPQAPPPPGGYGYPAAGGPQFGAPQFGGAYQQTPPPAAKNRKRLAVIVGAVTAFALLLSGGVWYALQGGGDDDPKKDGPKASSGAKGGGGAKGADKPRAKEGKFLFGAELATIKDTSRPAGGMWVTGKVFAKGDLDKVVGYGLTGGKQWEIPLDGDICSAPKHVTADGKTAVLVAQAPPSDSKPYGGPCNQVVALDLDHGKKLWQKSVRVGDKDVTFSEVTVGGGTVAAGGLGGGAAWSLEGKELWKPKEDDSCRDDGYGGGSKLVAVQRCGDYERPQMKVQTLDPATGMPKSSFKVPSGLQYVHVVSTDPLVIGVNAGDHTGNGVSDFMAIDDSGKDGKLRSKIATENGKFVPRCPSTAVEGCYKLAVTKDTLYLPSDDHQTGKSGEVGRVNEVVAFDLANGKSKGKTDGRVSSSMVPIGTDGDGAAIAYLTASWRAGGTVVRIDPNSFAAQELLKNPLATQKTEAQISPLFEQAIWAQGRLYLGRNYIHKPSPFADGKEYIAMIWGTG